jgi:hypothetical protein
MPDASRKISPPPPSRPRANLVGQSILAAAGFQRALFRGARGARWAPACRVPTFQKPSCSVGQVVRGTLWVRRIVNPPAARRPACFDAAMQLCGAANPGCSRLSAGSLRLALHQFLPQETLPKRSSIARVNAVFLPPSTAKSRRPRPRRKPVTHARQR